MRRNYRLRALAGGEIDAEDVRFGRRPGLRDLQLERVARVEVPCLRRVDAMPSRQFVLLEQEVDRRTDRSLARSCVGSPGLGIPAALGVRPKSESIDDLAGVHPRRIRSTRPGVMP